MASGIGPKEGPESPDAKKDKKTVDSAAFKEMMRVGKVRETDPEEQRKRKSKQEVEAEASAMAQSFLQQPQAPTTPEAEETFKIDTSNLAETAPSAPSAAPSEEETAPPPPSLPPEGYTPAVAEEPTMATQKEKTKKAKKKELDKLQKPPQIKKPAKPTAPEIRKETAFPEKRELFPEKLASLPPQKEEEIAEEMEVGAPMQPQLPLGSWERIKEESEEKKVEAALPVSEIPKEIMPTGYEIPAPFSAAFAPFAKFPQMWELFDRMVGVMTVMTDSGITETTVNLTSEQFQASPFYGTQIIIREFSTAPKNFNIEILVPPQAVGQIQSNYNELVAAFQAGQYNFKVNRLEWRQLPAKKEEKKGKVTKTKKSK